MEPVYFKRINFPFDQCTGLLVCGVELTARGETRGELKGLSNRGREAVDLRVREGTEVSDELPFVMACRCRCKTTRQHIPHASTPTQLISYVTSECERYETAQVPPPD